MKLGVDDRRKVAVACALSGLALMMLRHWIFGSESSASAHSESSPTIATTPATPARKIKVNRSDSLDPTLRVSQLEATEHEVYVGSGRNIFRSYGEEPQSEKVSPRPAPKPQPPTPSIEPAAPTIRLKFFGIATISGLARKVCLLQDGDVFIGAEGDIVDRRYKILRIGPNTVAIEDLLEKTEHTLTLQQ